MKNPPGFLLPGLNSQAGARLAKDALSPEVQQHMKALRIEIGEDVYLLDGHGTRYRARLVKSRPLEFEVLEAKLFTRTPLRIELCLAPPKGDALWEAITQSTEMGVDSIRFVRSDNVQAYKVDDKLIARAQRVADAACEQCLQAWRVSIQEEPSTLNELLSAAHEATTIHADESLSGRGTYGFSESVTLQMLSQKPVRLFIGPEGGWSERERQLFDTHSSLALGLGPLILRVPTASVAAIYHLRSLG